MPARPDTRAAVPAWRATFSGLSASLVGIGLARFAYTPLMPALIAAGWFVPSQAAYLGATNFAGYFAGALAASRLARLPTRHVARGMMLLASVAFFACAAPLPFIWFAAWRFAAGFAGGVLMVLAAPSILPLVPPHRRGLAGGAIFTGIGLGIAAAGTIIPPLLQFGLGRVWIALGILSLLLTGLAWGGWPRVAQAPPPLDTVQASERRGLWGVVLAYGLNAVGLVPHMVFLVDYVARGLGRGMQSGAACWVAFGIGAALGPLTTGMIADRIGFVAAFRVALVLQVAIVAVPLLTTARAALLASAATAGVFALGIVALAIGRVHLVVPPGSAEARAGWRRATMAWAVGQAGGAYIFSFIYAQLGSARPLFVAGCASLLMALVVDVSLGRTARP